MASKRSRIAISCITIGGIASSVHAAEQSASGPSLEEVVVTAQRKEERLQDVPISVTALSPDDLKAQRIETGANLAQAVPNMAFQPGAYAKPNFVIRGIGYQLVTSTGEAGVAIHVNDAPLTLSRIAQEDFYDVERVEVLRGPQGTLYGRNATGGVINVISKKPTHDFDASVTGEFGDYNTYKANGYINVPMGQMFALRVAGDYSKRDGYQTNEFNGDDVGNADMWSARATLAFDPSDRFHGRFMWEHFDQDDGGSSNGGNTRSICERDPGPTSIGSTSLTDGNARNAAIRGYESLGCAPTSIYNSGVLTGAVNGVGDFGNRLGNAIGLTPGDVFANNAGSGSRYGVNFDLNPYNRSKNDLAQLEFEIGVSDSLNLIALGTYSEDHVAAGAGGWQAELPFTGGRTISSPQLLDGAAVTNWTNATFNDLKTREWSTELRLQSSFSGPVNFSVGGIYVELNRVDDVLIFDNINKYFGTTFEGMAVDPNPANEAYGAHYYYQSLNPYHLKSMAGFGEVYWTMTDTVTATLGFRYTDDKKTFDVNNSASNLLVPGVGITFQEPQVAEFKEPTGRLNVDWKPATSFTDSTLVYGSYSRGYKGGGFNPPNLVPQGTYDPEFVDAFEIGTKNELLNRSLLLNMSAFYYNYKGYQFTQAAVFGTVTSNIDAHIYGAELESAWEPVSRLRFNAQIGYLHTQIQDGPNASSIDQYNLTGGDPNLTVMKTLLGDCLVNTNNFAHLLSDIKNGVNTAGGATVPTVTSLANTFFAANLCQGTRPEYNLFAGVPGGAGISGVQLGIAGNRLPNTPSITVAVGAQYTFQLGSNWDLTPRVDYRHSGDFYTDLFNNEDNRVNSFDLANATVTLANHNERLSFQLYVKNLTDNDAVIGAALGGGAILGNPRSITVADPRTFGLSITKGF
jgi:outer membrane receptor protein involved in Fe transport